MRRGADRREADPPFQVCCGQEIMKTCDYEYSDTEPCAKGPFYKEYEGRRYCVLHYPAKEKSEKFNTALQEMIKRKDYDFRGVWFPEGRWFRQRVFDAEVNFHRATFGAKADFYSTGFSKGAVFRHTTFSEKADFSSTSFKEKANFKHAKFNSSADFKRATFECEADFEYAVFRADVRFSREEEVGKAPKGQIKLLNLRYSVIDKPERISFHNLTLSPRWFVDSDPRKFDFTRVTWERVSSQRRERNIRKNIVAEIGDLKGVSCPYASLSLAVRRLAANAEDNNRYDEASMLRYWSMETLRMGRHKEPAPGVLHGLYHFVSGYGERIGRAFLILLVGWALFAGLYMLTGHIKPQASSGLKGYFNAAVRASNYSLQVITLQKPEPKAESGYLTPLLVTAETVLGPLQVALLALAIRRKFMR